MEQIKNVVNTKQHTIKILIVLLCNSPSYENSYCVRNKLPLILLFVVVVFVDLFLVFVAIIRWLVL